MVFGPLVKSLSKINGCEKENNFALLLSLKTLKFQNKFQCVDLKTAWKGNIKNLNTENVHDSLQVRVCRRAFQEKRTKPGTPSSDLHFLVVPHIPLTPCMLIRRPPALRGFPTSPRVD